MRKKILIILWVLFLFMLTQNVYGVGKVAQSKMQFIKIGIGGRPTAMGDAYTAQAGDPFCVFYNPAGLAFVPSPEFSMNRTNWFADISQMSFLYTHASDRFGVFGVNIISMDYGKLTGTKVDPYNWLGYEETGDFTVSEFAIGAAYAKNITDNVSLGGQVKYFYQDLGDVTAWRYPNTAMEEETSLSNVDQLFAYDFGTFYKAGYKDITIGMSVQNFANRAIPLNFRFGISIDILQVFFNDLKYHALIFAADALHPRDSEERIHIGAEYAFKKYLYLRGGYKFNYDEENLTLGMGLNLKMFQKNIKFEYSFAKLKHLGVVGRYSLGFAL